MIIYWETLEKNAGDPALIPDYLATDYFGGVGRVKSVTAYPASPPYGAIRYRSDLKKYLGFMEDSGWGELGGVGGCTETCRVWRSASQTIPNDTDTVITFDTENWDTDNFHDNVTNPSRLTAPVTGYYLVSGVIRWAGNAVGLRQAAIYKNGAVIAFASTSGNALEVAVHISEIAYLAQGDYVELYGYQTSGGNLAAIGINSQSTHFEIHRLS